MHEGQCCGGSAGSAVGAVLGSAVGQCYVISEGGGHTVVHPVCVLNHALVVGAAP